jgi:DNA-binding MarR family transcriptional regulator
VQLHKVFEIMRALAESPATTAELAERWGKSPGYAAARMKQIVKTGLVRYTIEPSKSRRGTRRYYLPPRVKAWLQEAERFAKGDVE